MFDWITSFVEQSGYLGIGLLMFLENVFPPIPSELIMPLAGFGAARGHMSLIWVVIVGSIGSMAGASIWYYVGYSLGQKRLIFLADRHGRWLTVRPDEILKAAEFFERHSGKSVLLARMIPALRTLISVPAGLAEMPMGKFLIYTGVGTFVWTGILAGAGYLLENNYQRVSTWINPISNLVVGVLIAGYIYRLLRFKAVHLP
jgi:membrane protein DedA with SNARE-associated domain